MKGYIYSNQMSLYGERDVIGFGSNEFYVKEIDKDLANAIIIENHYSKKIYSATYIHLGVFVNNEMLGVLQYGYAMNPASCGSVVKNTQMDEYLELNRMWLSDKAQRNSESKALSYSIKYIRGKFKKIRWVQSFADERFGGFGIVYQAANFSYYGEHTAIFWEFEEQTYHNTIMTAKNGKEGKFGKILQANKDKATSTRLRQFRYIYFIDQRKKKDCLLKEKPYPKHYKE